MINFGWIPDKKDDRDLLLTTAKLGAGLIVRKASIKKDGVAILNQGDYGTCVGHGGVRSIAHAVFNETKKKISPSRAFAYQAALLVDGVDCDPQRGTQIRSLIKGAVRYGVPLEKDYRYTDANLRRFPLEKAMEKAEKYQALKYYNIANGNVELMKLALANGFCPVFGARIFNSFQSEFAMASGIVPHPPRLGDGLLGGHCMAIEECDDDLTAQAICDRLKLKQGNLSKAPGYFTIANSWGSNVGDKGYFYMPYSYFADTSRGLVSDIWCITQNELGK
jgi:C1A family cysteine protease